MTTPRRPLSSRPPPADGADPRRGSGTRTKFEGRKVLVVDDCEDNRDLLAAVLRDAGFVVSVACDGVEALEVASAERPHVVVMDLAMPRMDGFEAIDRLRREEYGGAIRVVVFSAFTDRVSRARAQQLGADAFVAKPCTPRDLLSEIEEAFSPSEGRAATG